MINAGLIHFALESSMITLRSRARVKMATVTRLDCVSLISVSLALTVTVAIIHLAASIQQETFNVRVTRG